MLGATKCRQHHFTRSLITRCQALSLFHGRRSCVWHVRQRQLRVVRRDDDAFLVAQLQAARRVVAEHARVVVHKLRSRRTAVSEAMAGTERQTPGGLDLRSVRCMLAGMVQFACCARVSTCRRHVMFYVAHDDRGYGG